MQQWRGERRIQQLRDARSKLCGSFAGAGIVSHREIHRGLAPPRQAKYTKPRILSGIVWRRTEIVNGCTATRVPHELMISVHRGQTSSIATVGQNGSKPHFAHAYDEYQEAKHYLVFRLIKGVQAMAFGAMGRPWPAPGPFPCNIDITASIL